MIYSGLPTDWKDLQTKVAKIFEDIGFETEVEKTIETTRGGVTVDVYAKDASQAPNVTYLCECKYWE